MITVDSFVALDYIVWVLSGIVFLVGLLVGLYVLPWVKLMRKYSWMRRCCYCLHHDGVSLRQTDFQELWVARFVLQIDIAALAVRFFTWYTHAWFQHDKSLFLMYGHRA